MHQMEVGGNLFGMRNQGCGINFAAGQVTSHQTGRHSLLKTNFCVIPLQTIIIAQEKRPRTADFQYKYYKLKDEKHEKKIRATYIHLYKRVYIYIHTLNKNVSLQISVQLKNIQFQEETNQPMRYCCFRFVTMNIRPLLKQHKRVDEFIFL